MQTIRGIVNEGFQLQEKVDANNIKDADNFKDNNEFKPDEKTGDEKDEIKNDDQMVKVVMEQENVDKTIYNVITRSKTENDLAVTDAEISKNIDMKNVKDKRKLRNEMGNILKSKNGFLAKIKDKVMCFDEHTFPKVTQRYKCNDADDVRRNDFTDSMSKRFRSDAVTESWRRRSLGNEDGMWKSKAANPELSRSQYSLVSCGELTPGALQLWVELPEEIKYDPALASFRQLYEKEHGNVDIHQPKARSSSVTTNKRLPLVSSAPHLNNNLHVLQEPPIGNGCPHDRGIEMQEIGKRPEMGSEDVSKISKMARTRLYIKLSLLLACWVFFTVVFLMYNEKETVVRNSAIKAGETKDYILHISEDKLTLLLELTGPFLSQQMEKQMNASQLAKAHKMEVWLDRWTLKNGTLGNQTSASNAVIKESSKLWALILQEDNQLDFNEGEPRSSKLHLGPSDNSDPNRTIVYVIRMKSTTTNTVPFTMSYTQNPIDNETGIIYACLLLCGLYVLIIFEVINRTMAAIIISMLSLAALSLAGERPSLQEIVSWLDVETLLLLFSMMLLVAIMAETGIFDFLAVYTFEVTKGRMWPLINLLCAITAVMSTVLDNVTTVLLMSPVTIRLCEVMDLNPVPILMWMVLYSNIGGTATPVGDPPNVIIASNRVVKQYGINFTNFTLHMTLGILLVSVQTYLHIRLLYRNTNKLRLNTPRNIQDLRQQIAIWRRAADSLPYVSRDENIVRERLEKKIRKLNSQLKTLIKDSYKRACPKETFESTLADLKSKYKIRDKVLLVKTSVAVIFVVIVFFLHSIPELNRVSLGWTALLGALLLLVLADREDLEPVLHRVEWSTLLFFAALFVLTEALSKLGFIAYIGGMTESLIMQVDERGRLAVAILLMLWVSGLTSAFVDNIPLTTMMIRVVVSLGSNPTLNLPMKPLIWALSFGACLGGNGTLIGASANVVCAGVAEQHGYKFTFMQFFRMGFPIMVGHLVVASGYLLLCHCVFTWH